MPAFDAVLAFGVLFGDVLMQQSFTRHWLPRLTMRLRAIFEPP
jgi:hypothetical protein